MPSSLDPRAEGVLDFWLGELDADGLAARDKSSRWWQGNDALDQTIRQRFLELHEQAAASGLLDWAHAPRGALALVLLLDQFPRNMFRGAARAFATDGAAREVAREAIDRHHDRVLKAHERAFLYLPFMHSESLCDQHLGMRLFQVVAAELDGRAAEELENNLVFMARHFEIVERFGRFPHRNAVLQRTSTDEERRFLEQPGSSF